MPMRLQENKVTVTHMNGLHGILKDMVESTMLEADRAMNEELKDLLRVFSAECVRMRARLRMLIPQVGRRDTDRDYEVLTQLYTEDKSL